MELLENAEGKMETIAPKKTGEKCPECGHDLVVRKGRYGEFVACSNFPACKYVVTEPKESLGDCPKCDDGNVVEKKTRRGKVFYACDNFPKCDYAVWNKEDIGKIIEVEKKVKAKPKKTTKAKKKVVSQKEVDDLFKL